MAVARDTMETAVFAAVLLGGIYLMVRRPFAQAQEAFTSATQKIGAAIGERLFVWTHPGDDQPIVTYFVEFPDGIKRAVNSESVDRDGYFSYWRDGSKWRMAVSETGLKFAVAV